MSTLPLVAGDRDRDIIAWHDGQALTVAQFLPDVARVAAQLPPDGGLINLCENRYHFLLGFAAALCRGLLTLLPPNRSEQTVADLLADHPGSRVLDDAWVLRALVGPAAPLVPEIDGERLAATLFTSGSTGKPSAHAKRWREFFAGAQLTRRQLPFPEGGCNVLATVPPQHMFGLETTIVLPLVGGMRIDTGRPFFPADIRARLQALPTPRVLVTTPLHLKACLDAGLDWPAVEFVLSATAPMSPQLAAQAEAAFAAPVMEIYGSTETGAIATRRTAVDGLWTPHPGVRISQDGDSAIAEVDHLDLRLALNDRVEVESDGRFRLLGRTADLINIAGKRASLADLNLKLLAIEGVRDGVFLMPDEHDERARLTAFVVAPEVDNQTILEQLRRVLDPVFLPRPLHRVQALPRNAAGKLPRQALIDLLRTLERN